MIHLGRSLPLSPSLADMENVSQKVAARAAAGIQAEASTHTFCGVQRRSMSVGLPLRYSSSAALAALARSLEPGRGPWRPWPGGAIPPGPRAPPSCPPPIRQEEKRRKEEGEKNGESFPRFFARSSSDSRLPPPRGPGAAAEAARSATAPRPWRTDDRGFGTACKKYDANGSVQSPKSWWLLISWFLAVVLVTARATKETRTANSLELTLNTKEDLKVQNTSKVKLVSEKAEKTDPRSTKKGDPRSGNEKQQGKYS